ncbi:MAG TPA: hypothetical protein VNV85_07300, partial [Puia sp.]|nr:hypothetical protein [Puia sp.]
MKKSFIIFFIFLAVVFGSCKKSTLQLPNPNQPTPGSLSTEAGAESFAMGIFSKWLANVPGEGNSNIFELMLMAHSNMGDEDFCPWANWGMRYPANVNQIILPPPYNTVVPNPSGLDQQGALVAHNSRQAGEQNALQYEWDVCYFMNAQCNLLLNALSTNNIAFSGDAATKKQLLTAWAYWWKGYIYSRLGSVYISGVINNDPANGITNGNFVSHDTITNEGNANFDKAATILNSLVENGDYDFVFQKIVPSFNNSSNIITPAMWVRQINSYKARNYLVNKKVAAMTASDWTQVLSFANNGMVQGDFSFMFGMAPGATNDLSANFYHPYAFHSLGNGFAWVSERLIQEYKSGDARFTKNFELQPGGPVVNVRNRGIQFGTRYNVIDIENGGSYATDNSVGAVSISTTWEENVLMIAEAKIRSGQDIDGGLA